MKKVLLLLVSTVLSSCTYYQPVTNPSGSVLVANLPHDKFTILGSGTGEACGRFVLGYPLATATGEKNTYQAAVRNALRSKNGDHFIQTTADFSFVGFPLPQYAIYQEVCVTVEGLVIKLH